MPLQETNWGGGQRVRASRSQEQTDLNLQLLRQKTKFGVRFLKPQATHSLSF